MSVGGGFVFWLGQALVVGIGWFVVHRLSAARDIDKARRELVAAAADTLISDVSTLLVDSINYHTVERNVSAELALKMGLQDLALKVAGLSSVCRADSDLAACRSAVSLLRRAITGTHFEDEHEEPLAHEAEALQHMADAAVRVKQGLLRLKHGQFAI